MNIGISKEDMTAAVNKVLEIINDHTYNKHERVGWHWIEASASINEKYDLDVFVDHFKVEVITTAKHIAEQKHQCYIRCYKADKELEEFTVPWLEEDLRRVYDYVQMVDTMGGFRHALTKDGGKN